MQPKQPRRIRWTIYGVTALIYFVTFFGLDWKYFFPLRAHTDLRFQLTGEIVAIGIVCLSILLTSLILKVREREQGASWAMPTFLRVVLMGFPWANGMIAVDWREYFSGEVFQPRSLLLSILICYGSGLFIAVLVARAIDSNREDDELRIFRPGVGD